MKAIERLEALLDEKDEQIRKLEFEVDGLSNELDADPAWSRHTRTENDPHPNLPIPRLQIVCIPEDDWETRIWTYSLVYRHLTGDVIQVPLGKTRISGGFVGEREVDPIRDLPFRDGAHIRVDSSTLALPAFSIVGDSVSAIEPRVHPNEPKA